MLVARCAWIILLMFVSMGAARNHSRPTDLPRLCWPRGDMDCLIAQKRCLYRHACSEVENTRSSCELCELDYNEPPDGCSKCHFQNFFAACYKYKCDSKGNFCHNWKQLCCGEKYASTDYVNINCKMVRIQG